jgi:uncharacterized membrane protein YsdA (DUF1294 family)
MNRHLISLIPGLLIPAAFTFAYHRTLNLPPLIIWLVTINLMLMALMGKDKFAASKKWPRTPEATLLILTFLGATPALLLSRYLFRHKTKKQEFLYAMVGTIAAQAVCIWYFWPQLQVWL